MSYSSGILGTAAQVFLHKCLFQKTLNFVVTVTDGMCLMDSKKQDNKWWRFLALSWIFFYWRCSERVLPIENNRKKFLRLKSRFRFKLPSFKPESGKSGYLFFVVLSQYQNGDFDTKYLDPTSKTLEKEMFFVLAVSVKVNFTSVDVALAYTDVWQ